MCGLGVCIWVCASHALRLQHLNVGVDTYAWLRYAVSVDRVIPLAQRRSARPLSWFFACAMSITVPNSEQAAAAVLYSWVGDPMHARILFFSVYWVWYYTYVVHHYLFIVSVCCMLLCPVVLNFAIVICSAHSLQLYSVSCWTSLSGVSSCYILHFSICRCMCYVYVSMCSWLWWIDLCYVYRLCYADCWSVST